MKLSVVVPVHNEAENIASLVEEIRLVLENTYDYEAIFVDDGSTDQSPDILRRLQGKYPRLGIVRHSHHYGQSAALMSGVRAAVGSVIVTLDGDGQNDPRDIPRLLDVFSGLAGNQEPVMVTGLRSRRRDTAWRRLCSRIANAVRSRLLHDETPDTGCGLKVFSRDLFMDLPAFDHMHRFLPALVQRAGGRVVSVEVNHRPRRHGRSHYRTLDRLWVGIVDLLGVMWLIRRNVIAQVERTKPHE
ncbi:MAG: glycosyltransferase family 2 protein [Deltaproteobacteria bacterium]|nr:glycosyltransferase family 2 protein [Deltaproteobacteria bacterium]